jgi:hypothetical protein
VAADDLFTDRMRKLRDGLVGVRRM